MASDSGDDSLVISDWDGNLYRIPRSVLEQCRIPNAEPLGAIPPGSSTPEDSPVRWWRAFMPHEDGRRRPPGPLPTSDR